MKRILFLLLTAAVVYFCSACTKTNNVTTTVHDTTTLIIRDTTTKIIKDTLVITAPKNPITGLWVGTYTVDGSESLGSFYYGWTIFADHTIIQQGGGQHGLIGVTTGTWTLSADSTFTADVVPADNSQGNTSQHITAKYSASAGTLSQGHWIYTNSSQTGSFTLKRVND